MTSKRSLSQSKRDRQTHAALVKAVQSLDRKLTLDEVNGYATAFRLVTQAASLTTLPRARYVNGTAAQRELQQAAQKADAFAKALHALPRNAHDAYRAVWQQRQQEWLKRGVARTTPGTPANPVPSHADIVMLMDAVVEFAEAASSAQDLVVDASQKRLRKPQSYQVTSTAHKIYEKVTGRPPTRRTASYEDGKSYGPMLSFLTKVFTALGVKASPDAQLKSFLSARKQEES